jgi:molybdenum cofactor synthesis domain-containing protein
MRSFRAAVLTVSDSVSHGEREDLSGPLAVTLLEEAGYAVADSGTVPDDREQIESRLRGWADSGAVDLVLTTGGTGLSPRDVTPEATMAVCDREAPGIAEMLRSQSAAAVPAAWLSRGVAGTRKGTLVVNMPGSAGAVGECLAILLPVLGHALEVLTGGAGRCGT